MKKCPRCRRQLCDEMFINKHGKDIGVCVDCSKRISLYSRSKKPNSSIYRYIKEMIHSNKVNVSRCMVCGRPFNYMFQYNELEKYNSYDIIERPVPLKSFIYERIHLCEECNCDIIDLWDKPFLYTGQRTSFSQLDGYEIDVILGDYISPSNELKKIYEDKICRNKSTLPIESRQKDNVESVSEEVW